MVSQSQRMNEVQSINDDKQEEVSKRLAEMEKDLKQTLAERVPYLEKSTLENKECIASVEKELSLKVETISESTKKECLTLSDKLVKEVGLIK